MKLWIDRETWSELDLKVVGTYVYAANAEDLLVAYAIDDEPAKVWDCTDGSDIPDDLWHAMTSADEVWAHNAAFDKAVHNGPAQCCLPRIALTRWRCSMAQALSHALPASLSELCEVLKVPEDMAKLAEGKKLVKLFTQPQPANRKIRRACSYTHPAEWERFKAYAINDIVAMRECVQRMPTWNWNDSAVAEWHCDQRINERGFKVDQELTRAGAAAAIGEKDRIGRRFRELTGGVVDRPSQRAQFQAYLNTRFGLHLDNTRSDTFNQEMKRKDLDPTCRELMLLAIASNKTSTAKYAALDPAVSADGRFRGGLQFAGAARTRRFAGRMFQPQNLPSRGLPPAEDIERYIECLKAGTHDLFFDNLMLFGAAALRGVVIAEAA
jgi:DNA polymerase